MTGARFLQPTPESGLRTSGNRKLGDASHPEGKRPCGLVARLLAIFEPVASRSCPLRPQREAPAEPSNARFLVVGTGHYLNRRSEVESTVLGLLRG